MVVTRVDKFELVGDLGGGGQGLRLAHQLSDNAVLRLPEGLLRPSSLRVDRPELFPGRRAPPKSGPGETSLVILKRRVAFVPSRLIHEEARTVHEARGVLYRLHRGDHLPPVGEGGLQLFRHLPPVLLGHRAL